jgi:hypothetical protein
LKLFKETIMQATRNTPNDVPVARPTLVHHARAIPPLTHREAVGMAKLEFERFLALVTSFSEEDWEKPRHHAELCVKTSSDQASTDAKAVPPLSRI